MARYTRKLPPLPAKRKVGRPAYAATDGDRLAVRLMVSFGYSEEQMARLVKQEGNSISVATLRREFRRELEDGAAMIEVELAKNVIAVSLQPNAASAAIALKVLERRFSRRWKETIRNELTDGDGAPLQFAVINYAPEQKE